MRTSDWVVTVPLEKLSMSPKPTLGMSTVSSDTGKKRGRPAGSKNFTTLLSTATTASLWQTTDESQLSEQILTLKRILSSPSMLKYLDSPDAPIFIQRLMDCFGSLGQDRLLSIRSELTTEDVQGLQSLVLFANATLTTEVSQFLGLSGLSEKGDNYELPF